MQIPKSIRALGLWALLLYAGGGAAQALDDVEISGAGGQAQITVRFAAQVRYQRHVVDPTSTSAQVFLQVTGENSGDGVFEDTRSSPPTRDLPAFVVRYLAPQGGVPARRLDINFEAPVEFVRIGQGSDNRSLVLQLRAQAPAAAAPAAPPVAAATDDPLAMLAQGKEALARQDYDSAIALLNRILNLPPNGASQEAQELIGQVREALGSNDRARAEYQLYLKLYPDGDGAARVRERLAALDLPEAQAVAGGRAPRPRGPWARTPRRRCRIRRRSTHRRSACRRRYRRWYTHRSSCTRRRRRGTRRRTPLRARAPTRTAPPSSCGSPSRTTRRSRARPPLQEWEPRAVRADRARRWRRPRDSRPRRIRPRRASRRRSGSGRRAASPSRDARRARAHTRARAGLY